MAKFNYEVCEKLLKAHENGLPLKTCAKYAGIDRKTLYNWLKRGKEAKTGKYCEFYDQWQKAEAIYQLYHLKKINDDKSWQSSRYLLQVTDPETYVIVDKVENKTEIKNNGLDKLAELYKENQKAWKERDKRNIREQ